MKFAIYFFFFYLDPTHETSYWTILGPNKYNIYEAFSKTNLYPYFESEAYCGIHNQDSRLFYPENEDTKRNVLQAIKDAGYGTNTGYWTYSDSPSHCVQSNMDGVSSAVECTAKLHALCQMPGFFFFIIVTD